MFNQLQKEIKRTYTPATAGRPGFPGQPYAPARWAKVRTYLCGYSYSSTSGGTVNASEVSIDRYAVRNELVNVAGPPEYGCQWVYNLVFLEEQQYMPPIPPVAASKEKTVIDYQLGWNAKARSIVPMSGSGSFQFVVPRDTQGAVVGLSGSPSRSGYSDIAYGFYVSSGVVKIMESGKEIADLGPYPNADLKVSRSNGRIIYDINGTIVRDRPNTDAPLYLSAALYVGGDTVEDAELTAISMAYGGFPAMQGLAGNVAVNQAVGAFLPMAGESASYPTGSASGSFRAMYGAAADASGYAFSSGEFVPMDGEAEAFSLVPSYAFCDGVFHEMIGTAQGVMHIIGQASGSFKPMAGLSSNFAYSESRGEFATMRGYASALEGPDQATIFSSIYGDYSLQPVSTAFALIDADFNVSGVFTVTSVATASVDGDIGFSSDYQVAQTLRAAIESWMESNTDTFNIVTSRDAWVYHMDANGSTRYVGYDFSGFAKVGDSYYGLKPDGLYLLEGSDDDGDPVTARVNFGSRSFGSMNRKSLPFVYVGMASSGKTYLKVIADGQTYTYAVRDNTEMMKSHRYELGRGLRAVFYEVELIADGEVFDLHNIDFQAIELKRSL